MSAFSFILWKFGYELDRIAALARYPLHRDNLTARLSGSMSGIGIETVNICNANCTFCAYQYQTRPVGTMSMPLYRKIIDEYVECGGGNIGLTPTVGDPFIDRDLLARIAYARGKLEIRSIGMYSNMISLGLHGAEALVNSGLTGLAVSVCGLDEQMYRRVYRSKQYRRVLSNIKEFAQVNNAAGRPVHFTLNIRSDRSLAETFAFPDHKVAETLVGKENISLNMFFDSWGGKITQDQLTGRMKLRGLTNIMRPRISPCTELFSGPFVTWNGRVIACSCRDVDAAELVIGDANADHLGAIWFGSEIRKLREEFLTDKIKAVCDTCSHYQNLSLYLTKRAKPELDALRPSPYLAGRMG